MVYLDWASTAMPQYNVSDYNDFWFNPNSNYAVTETMEFGRCEDAVKKAIGAKSGKVIFGGNASWFFDRLTKAIPTYWGCGLVEHDCVYRFGSEIHYKEFHLQNGIYCHQLVNNITGEIFNVEEIGKAIKTHDGYFVCDATAAIGRCSVPDKLEDWCDALVMSSHKVGVDNKQIGCAWVSDRLAHHLCLGTSVVHGYGWVDGTPDLASAEATTTAVSVACGCVEDYDRKYRQILWDLVGLFDEYGIKYKGIYAPKRSASINAIILDGINANALCNYLASENIYISPGHSACEEDGDYRVLKRYGLSQSECESTIRVSFGPTTTPEDIEEFVKDIVNFKERFCNG